MNNRFVFFSLLGQFLRSFYHFSDEIWSCVISQLCHFFYTLQSLSSHLRWYIVFLRTMAFAVRYFEVKYVGVIVRYERPVWMFYINLFYSIGTQLSRSIVPLFYISKVKQITGKKIFQMTQWFSYRLCYQVVNTLSSPATSQWIFNLHLMYLMFLCLICLFIVRCIFPLWQ